MEGTRTIHLDNNVIGILHRHATRQGTAREGHGGIHFTQQEHTGVCLACTCPTLHCQGSHHIG